MSNEAKKQLVISFLDAFSKGRNDEALAMFTDSATWWTAGVQPRWYRRRPERPVASWIQA